MKTILLLALISPVPAFASYHCISVHPPGRGLQIDESDPANITTWFDHQFYEAKIIATGPTSSESVTYELKDGLGGIEGTIVIHKLPIVSNMPTRAPMKSIISATLATVLSPASEFDCTETLP